jgi:hypothetical protein
MYALVTGKSLNLGLLSCADAAKQHSTKSGTINNLFILHLPKMASLRMIA